MTLKFTKRRLFWLLACVAFIGSIGAGYAKLHAVWRKSATDRFRTAAIRRGDIKFEVKSSGTVQPVLSVQVGSYVSGPIQKVYVDFNDKVKKDQILAEIDPKVYKAQCRQAKASLAHSVANLEQFKARLNQTEQDFNRAKKLYKISDIPGAKHPIKGIADSDYDLAKANFEMAAANVDVAKATVEQNKAALDMVETNLAYTEILSPVDGTIIDRKVDAGQTLASQFQTPVLFVVAPDLEKKVHILASVDEADIGFIRKAELNDQPVSFKVDAYQEDDFEGKIVQIRLNPTTVQNVVTYTVVVASPNNELKLLPGMTASLSFQIEKRSQILKIPNSALRFHPKSEQIQPKYRALLDKLRVEDGSEDAAATENLNGESDQETTPGEVDKKYVWILEGELLAPVEVKTGVKDIRYTELLSGDLAEGRDVVTGMKTASEAVAEPPPPPPQ